MNKRIRFPLFILVYVTSFLLIFNIDISEERLLMIPQKQPSDMIDNELKSKNLIYGKVIFFKIGLENLDSNYKLRTFSCPYSIFHLNSYRNVERPRIRPVDIPFMDNLRKKEYAEFICPQV